MCGDQEAVTLEGAKWLAIPPCLDWGEAQREPCESAVELKKGRMSDRDRSQGESYADRKFGLLWPKTRCFLKEKVN